MKITTPTAIATKTAERLHDTTRWSRDVSISEIAEIIDRETNLPELLKVLELAKTMLRILGADALTEQETIRDYGMLGLDVFTRARSAIAKAEKRDE